MENACILQISRTLNQDIAITRALLRPIYMSRIVGFLIGLGPQGTMNGTGLKDKTANKSSDFHITYGHS